MSWALHKCQGRQQRTGELAEEREGEGGGKIEGERGEKWREKERRNDRRDVDRGGGERGRE